MSSEGLKEIFTKNACPPAGPYSQAVHAQKGTPVFVAGQLPADASGNLVGGSIANQTKACCENIKGILAAAGSDMSRVVRVGVYLAQMSDFAEMNEEYSKHFPGKPARTTIAVKELPKGVPIEIDCVAVA